MWKEAIKMGKMVVSFTHSNYCIKPTGTEKFVRNLSEILQDGNYDHLNFFPFYSDVKSVGVNYNDKFMGVYDYEQIAEIINFYANKYANDVVAVHFQHLLNHKLDILTAVVNNLKVPVSIVLHDYYLICNRLKMIDTNEHFCGVSKPCTDKCIECLNKEMGIKHFDEMQHFLNTIDPFIYRVIAPSEYVAEHVKRVFPEIAEKIVVRAHLRLSGSVAYTPNNGKIRLAYVGAPMKEKGFSDWKQLVREIRDKCPDKYELFYFGTGKQVIDGVKNVYVSTSEQGENAMMENLRNYGIECAFVWPNWAETYSYVYYELALCGVFIVSNKISGNIYSEIKQNENGRIFSDRRDVVAWFLNSEDLRKEINTYRVNAEYKPKTFEVNTDLSDFLFPRTLKNREHVGKTLINKKIAKSILYRLKYYRFMN